jgi:hypothetical protein
LKRREESRRKDEGDMIRNQYMITGNDTKLLRHEKQLEVPAFDDWLGASNRYPRHHKVKRILATITAKDEAHGEVD